ncbi:MAG: spermidine/putrescine ABC transporter substrate-binding protein [Dehalococcoidia bacterium]|nr:spermidine/putrescine ABC transporter substrate-binding protein [Dehalococcoidia bacterium]
MNRRKNLLALIGTVVLLVSLSVPLMQCAPAAEEEAPPVEEEGPYEAYVSSLPEGCFPVTKECFEQAKGEGQLNIYDWAEWWPEDIYEGFSEEFGIKIVRDNFADMTEVLAKFKLYPEVEYDFVLPESRLLIQMKELGVLQRINHDWVPNVNEYLPEATKQSWYDPGYQYGVASDLYILGYSYNTKYVDDPRIPSWAVLFEPDEKYKGRITMLNSMYGVIGSALKYLGYSWNSDDEDELMEVKELLLRQKPWVMAYESWPARIVLEEEAWIAHQWYGDAYFLSRELESLRVALPVEGSQKGMDFMVIPIGSAHPAAAHLFINYIFRPEVNGLLIETIGYLPNHTTVGEFLSEELQEIQPSEEYLLDKCEYETSKAYAGKGKELRSAIWEELKM